MNQDTHQQTVLDDAERQRLERAVRTELDNSIQDLDAYTLARLSSARRKAVQLASASTEARRGMAIWSGSNWLLPAGSVAAFVAVIALTFSVWRTESVTLDMANLEDMAVLSASEDLEMLDDLDFYQWLEDEKHSNS